MILLAGLGRAESVYYTAADRIKGFDPVCTGDAASIRAMALIYEGLLQYHYLDRPYRLIPLLAASMPTVSDDGLTIEFEIRRDIYFQDDPCFTRAGGRGRELTAEDFVYSIKRVADLKNASSGYWVFRGRLEGLDDFRRRSGSSEPTDYGADVPGVRAPDRYRLVFRLTEPYPQFLWILAMHYAFVVPREAVEYYGDDLLNHPVGTGPYVLEEWRRNYRIAYRRNAKWNETGRKDAYPAPSVMEDIDASLLRDVGKPVPFMDRIVKLMVSDSTTRWMMFLSGKLSHSGVSRDHWDAVITAGRQLQADLRERGIRMYAQPTLDIYYIGFNMDDPVVGGNRKLRQALSCAFDHEAWIRFYNHRVAKPTGPVPAPLDGHLEGSLPFSLDLDRARRLLAEAGFPEGANPETGRRLTLTLEIADADNTELRQSTDLFVDFMSRIGVRIVPSYNNRPVFFDKVARREAQMFRLSWIADYPDAQNFLQLFYSKNASPGSNRANYTNPAFDALYEQIRTMYSGPERTALYERMARMVAEDCPWIFLHQPMSYDLCHAWVRNFKPHMFPYGMEKYRGIDGLENATWRGTLPRARGRAEARASRNDLND